MSLKKNVLWTFIGNIVYSGCQWLILSVISKQSSPVEVGQYTLALSVTAPVFSFFNFQLKEILSTDAKNIYDISSYIFCRFVTCLFALIFVLIVVLVGGYNGVTVCVIMIVAVGKVFESISDIVYGVMQKNEMMEQISLSLMIKGVFTLFVSFIILYHSSNIVFTVIGIVGSWFIVLFFYDLKLLKCALNTKKIICLYNVKNLFQIIKMSFPMGVLIMLNSLNMNMPRYKIASIMGEDSLGYFAAIASLVIAGNTIMSAVGSSTIPRLAKYYAFDRRAYVKLMFKSLAFAVLVGFGGIFFAYFFGTNILTIVYTADYANYSSLFVLTMILGMVTYCSSVFGNCITAARFYSIQAYVTVIVTISIFVSLHFAVPSYGFNGAIFSLLVGFVIKIIAQIFQIILILR